MCDATTLVVRSSRRQICGVIAAQVDGHRDPGQQTVREVATELHVLDVGVVVVGGLLEHPAVDLPAGELDGVGVVRVRRLDGVDERVFKVDLADVQRGAARVRVVRLHGVVVLGDEVEVGNAVVVVAGEQGVKGRDAVVVAELHAAQEGRVQSALAVRVDARVHARAVAVPDVGRDARNRSARVHVDELDVDVHGHARLTFGDVLADELAGHVVWTNSSLRNQRASVVGAKDGLLGRLESVLQARSLVVTDVGVSLEVGEISLLVIHGHCALSALVTKIGHTMLRHALKRREALPESRPRLVLRSRALAIRRAAARDRKALAWGESWQEARDRVAFAC